MKDSKISLLLFVSICLLLLAFIVLFIGGFAYYKQSSYSSKGNNIPPQAGANSSFNSRDSLQKIYNNSILKLNTELDATRTQVDSFQVNMDARLSEFSLLKNEIAGIVQNKPSTETELAQARQKMEELRLRLAEWRVKYSNVDEENRRLHSLLKQFGQQVKAVEQPGQQKMVDAKPVVEKNTLASVLISGLQLIAIMQLDDREQETNQALQTDELKGSFLLNAGSAALSQAEMFIVILQPDGKVMKRSAWESGLFETGEGRKIYSQKLNVDCGKAESRQLSFSITANEYQKGSYILRLYHNGKIIASTSKVLS